MTEEIIPIPEDASSSPKSGTISQQPSPSRMVTSPPPSLPPRNHSPVAMRPRDNEPGRASLESEIQDAVGVELSIHNGDGSTKQEGDLGSTL